ncbi:MAG: acetate--CoA ligase family protein [Candidatus Jordarchaeum sp.]|uniref:acetate--CoA ligase family protein n=1 Tax=Candidatus Jordarchaeum sp. TaxID=2823881 RepID=UPI004049D0C9
MDPSIKALFNPDSVAIVGASNNVSKLGSIALNFMIGRGFPKERVFPVNPSEQEVMGLRCYPSVADIPRKVDLVYILTPAQTVEKIVEDCIKNGVKCAMIGSAGFAEVGKVEEQNKLVSKARKGGLRLLGPNSQGILSTPNNFCACFSPTLLIPNTPIRGDVGLISHSGAIMGSTLTHMWDLGLGISRSVSTGNEADLETAEILDFMAEDPHTKTIVIYLEVIKNKDLFRKAAKKAREADKPVVVFNASKSQKARKITQYHTGLVSQLEEGYDPLLKDSGVILCQGVDDLYNLPMALSWQPKPKDHRIAVIATSGATCTITADLSEEYGLDVPEFKERAKEKLETILPGFAQIKNPLDVTGQIILNLGMFKECIETLCREDYLNTIYLIITSAVGDPAVLLANDIVEVSKEVKKFNKPLIVTWLASRILSQKAHELLLENRIPTYPTIRSAVKTIKEIADWEKGN